jgi:OOP family OmpA-OmpF porin
MTRYPTHTPLALAILGSLLAAPALAQDAYSYGGVGLGQAQARVDDPRIAEHLAGSGITASGISHDERHTAYKVFLGYQFNPSVGLELGFFRLGNFGFTATTVPAGSLTGDFRIQGANLDLVGTLPFSENFSGLARLGAQYARTLANVSGTGAVVVADPRPSDRAANVKIGLGLQYAFSRGFMMRGEVERFRVSDAVGNRPQVAMYSVSLVIPFGRSEAPARRAAVTPSYSPPPVALAPQPAPAPEIAVAPLTPSAPLAAFAPSQSRRVSYTAESFFSFDRSELRPEGKTALDSFVAELQGTSYDTITVQGHADRIGTTAYNQTLSLERAEAVKTYLVSAGHLEAAKIATVGKSELEPVTLPDDCKGPMSAPVIACLQPDRRVEIEVAGTR